MIVGIDLGTTNSACAVWQGDRAVMIPNRLGEVLTPSAVSIDADGGVLTGIAARDRQASHHDRTATAFKRYMGTDRVTTLAGRGFRAEELSALVLRALREDAEAYLGEAVTEAVITVPAYFNNRQRQATKRAGALAGLTVERLINEPTAAALAYGIHQLGDETRFLVFDLGGGTFDVSILEIFEGVIEVRSSAGDNHLGGEDFNEAIIDIALAKLPALGGGAAKVDPALYERLREQAERTRRALSRADAAPFELVWRGDAHRAEIDAAEFEARSAPLIARLRDPVLRSLRDGGLRPEALDEIVLIGGSTRMPLVRRTVTRMFGRFPNAEVNPDEAVALGAAIQAGLKARDATLSEVVVTDVCPYSLGVDTAHELPGGGFEQGLFSTVIERNTVIPASRENIYATLTDNQKQVTFGIYQGEDRHVVNNVRIGELKIPMPRGPAGQAILCRFSYDINGLLEVDLTVPKTGERRQLVITDDKEEGPAQIEARRAALAALKVHPRDSAAVQATMARAERCWQDVLGDERAHLEAQIRQFEAVVARQNPVEVERARVALDSVLDRQEGDAFL